MCKNDSGVLYNYQSVVQWEYKELTLTSIVLSYSTCVHLRTNVLRKWSFFWFWHGTYYPPWTIYMSMVENLYSRWKICQAKKCFNSKRMRKAFFDENLDLWAHLMGKSPFATGQFYEMGFQSKPKTPGMHNKWQVHAGTPSRSHKCIWLLLHGINPRITVWQKHSSFWLGVLGGVGLTCRSLYALSKPVRDCISSADQADQADRKICQQSHHCISFIVFPYKDIHGHGYTNESLVLQIFKLRWKSTNNSQRAFQGQHLYVSIPLVVCDQDIGWASVANSWLPPVPLLQRKSGRKRIAYDGISLESLEWLEWLEYQNIIECHSSRSRHSSLSVASSSLRIV